MSEFVMIGFNIDKNLNKQFELALIHADKSKSEVLRQAVVDFVNGDGNEGKVQDSRD